MVCGPRKPSIFDGQDQIAKRRIEDALRDPSEPRDDNPQRRLR
jgi:hypothetical protein